MRRGPGGRKRIFRRFPAGGTTPVPIMGDLRAAATQCSENPGGKENVKRADKRDSVTASRL